MKIRVLKKIDSQLIHPSIIEPHPFNSHYIHPNHVSPTPADCDFIPVVPNIRNDVSLTAADTLNTTNSAPKIFPNAKRICKN